MKLADAPNADGFVTGIRVHNANKTATPYTLTIVGGGASKDVKRTIPPYSSDSFFLSVLGVEPGNYGLAISGDVTGICQYAQAGDGGLAFYETAQIPNYT